MNVVADSDGEHTDSDGNIPTLPEIPLVFRNSLIKIEVIEEISPTF